MCSNFFHVSFLIWIFATGIFSSLHVTNFSNEYTVLHKQQLLEPLWMPMWTLDNYLYCINFQMIFQKLLKKCMKIQPHAQTGTNLFTEFASTVKYTWKQEGEREIPQLFYCCQPTCLPQFHKYLSTYVLMLLPINVNFYDWSERNWALNLTWLVPSRKLILWMLVHSLFNIRVTCRTCENIQ